MVLIVRTIRGNTLYHNPPDGGWSWVVLGSAFSINFLIFSLARCLGIFYNDFKSEFEATNSQTSWITAIATAMLGMAAPLGGFLMRKFDARKVLLAGGVLSCVGMMIAAFSTFIWMVYLGIGVMWGTGLCWTFLCGVTQVNMYFAKWRGIANGITACGTSVGSFVMPIFAQYLSSEYGWRGTMIIFAGLGLNSCVFASLIRPISTLSSAKMIKYQEVQYADKATDLDEIQAMTVSREVLDYIQEAHEQDPLMNTSTSVRIGKFINDYWLLMLMGLIEFAFGFCVFIPVIYIVPLAEELGCSSIQAALILSITAIGDIICRPLAGTLLSCFSVLEKHVLYFLGTIILIQTGVCLLVIFANDYQMLVIYAAVYGCFYGCFITVNIMTTATLLGVENIEKFVGYQYFISGVSILISPPIAGYFVDTFHTFKAAYWFLLGCYAITFILLMIGGTCVRKMGAVLPYDKRRIQSSYNYTN